MFKMYSYYYDEYPYGELMINNYNDGYNYYADYLVINGGTVPGRLPNGFSFLPPELPVTVPGRVPSRALFLEPAEVYPEEPLVRSETLPAQPTGVSLSPATVPGRFPRNPNGPFRSC